MLKLFFFQCPLVYFDSHYYGKTVFTPFNIIYYNIFGKGGPSLYGKSIHIGFESPFICHSIFILYTERSDIVHADPQNENQSPPRVSSTHTQEASMYPEYMCIGTNCLLNALQPILKLLRTKCSKNFTGVVIEFIWVCKETQSEYYAIE